MKRITIMIDGVIRNTYSALSSYSTDEPLEEYDENGNLIDDPTGMREAMANRKEMFFDDYEDEDSEPTLQDYVENEEVKTIRIIPQYDFLHLKEITIPVNEKEKHLPAQILVDEFIYNGDMAATVFSKAPLIHTQVNVEVLRIMSEAKYKKYQFRLSGGERKGARLSTFMFLASNNLPVSEVKFYDSIPELIQDNDIIVTSNPLVIAQSMKLYPNEKELYYLGSESDLNEYLPADKQLTVKNIFDLKELIL